MMIMLAIMPAGGWADSEFRWLGGKESRISCNPSLIGRAVRLALLSHTVILSILSRTIQPVYAVLPVQIFSPSTIENYIYGRSY
jgi:hypothetical protein